MTTSLAKRTKKQNGAGTANPTNSASASGVRAPALTVDVAAFSLRSGALSILLIRRKSAPFRGSWALPGGFVEYGESLESAARRELEEETGLDEPNLEPLGAFGDPRRDPRGHTVTVAFVAFMTAMRAPTAGDDAAHAEWIPVSKLALGTTASRGALRLAFDHSQIVVAAHRKLVLRLERPDDPSMLEIVPPHFTLSELQHVYEAVLGRPIDKRNFRTRLLVQALVEPVGEARQGRHRPAQLYRFRPGTRPVDKSPTA